MQPGAQQVRIADRAGLAGQHEEHRLEGILGMMQVAQELPANIQDHRPVPLHERRECGFSGRIGSGVEALDELPVGESGDGAAIE